MVPEQIPTTENIEFKPAFIERYSELTDWEEFKKYSLSFLKRSIRVNTILTTVKEMKKSIRKVLSSEDSKKGISYLAGKSKNINFKGQ